MPFAAVDREILQLMFQNTFGMRHRVADPLSLAVFKIYAIDGKLLGHNIKQERILYIFSKQNFLKLDLNSVNIKKDH